MKRKKNSKYDAEKIFSTIVTLAIIAALIVGVVSIVKSTQSDNDKNKNNYIDLNVVKGETTAGDLVVAPTQEETTPAKQVEPKPDETSADVQVVEPVTDNADPVNSGNIVSNYSFGEESTLAWPVSGDVIMKYNITNTVYFKTLNLYKTNDALIIGATVDTPVCAAASGVVESVTTNDTTGVTVVVAIGNEYKLVYGQLKNVTLAAGNTVEAGTQIGKIAEPSRCFIKEGSNLYFKLLMGDKTLDPMLFLEK